MNQFDAPEQLLADIDARSAAALICAAADVALVIDNQGVICDVSIARDELVFEGSADWVGRHWLETVTVESRPKVLALLRDATAAGAERQWRQVNHPVTGGPDIPVLYAALRVGHEGRVVAVGRDLRAVSALQQRLVDAQQALERDYLRLRQTEARYRLLFESVTEAVLLADATSLSVLEANPAAQRLLGDGGRRWVGKSLLEALEADCRSAAAGALASVRSTGRSEDLRVRLSADGPELTLGASLVRQDNGTLLLVRLVAAPTGRAAERGQASAALLLAVDRMPDAFVVTDPQGRVLTANTTFAELVQLPSGEALVGQSLDRWLGRSGVDLNVLMGTLKQHGVVRLFPTTLLAEFGLALKVEISAVAALQGELPCMGFTIRDVERRLDNDARAARDLPPAIAHLAELVGRVPMKDIVSETTDMIERMCIEAALSLTRDNRASAAEMLGLSRQSLYVKLRRYGLGELGSTSADGAATPAA
ncbi:transcriptional regulator PpsR [Aquabacterium sp.]|uniref:transcriptional regulator PpsR n=1 Tax=Aquabacterium sp. TaxID=1872578 RepID=UPI003784F7FA